jgi:hypothetical protein
MKEYEKRAKDAGVVDVHIVIEMGNPKTLLARTIPDAEEVDLICHTSISRDDRD